MRDLVLVVLPATADSAQETQKGQSCGGFSPASVGRDAFKQREGAWCSRSPESISPIRVQQVLDLDPASAHSLVREDVTEQQAPFGGWSVLARSPTAPRVFSVYFPYTG